MGALGHAPEIVYEDRALSRRPPRTFWTASARFPDASKAFSIVGHNPGLHELAQRLADTDTGPLADRLAANLATAGLVRFEVNIEWSGPAPAARARLVSLVTPKDLGARARAVFAEQHPPRQRHGDAAVLRKRRPVERRDRSLRRGERALQPRHQIGHHLARHRQAGGRRRA